MQENIRALREKTLAALREAESSRALYELKVGF